MVNITLFSQIIQKLNRSSFNKLVKNRQTDKHNKGLNSWTHLVSMLFCQFSKSQSVRDISNGLRSATGNLNHLGVEKAPSKSTLSYQNQRRDWELFRDYYYKLLETLGQQAYKRRVKFRIKSKIFLLDSTTISLCLSLFDWARYKTTKGAIKMHTLLDYDGHLPAYVHITDGKTADNKGAYDIPLLRQSVIVADRFYNDFSLLNVWDSNQVYFVIRHKENMLFKSIKENELPDNRHGHILKDEIIELTGTESKKKFPGQLRRVVVWNDENKQEIEIITNQMSWTANTISELYKARWQVEIFFREIKQLLHIKSFIGTSENAVMIQIWTALITILILKALKAMAKYPWYLSNLVAFIRLILFVKIELQKWLDNPFEEPKPPPQSFMQGVLF
ncbi:MAG TPA: IS4 family transposase [Candidatus Sphingobacterium stercoripullorum]|uniref:IS4 family transposase n=1 Tax=Candidatus Sphingobacterium stercoripullorum TaxID=2838759 RepID=A0A9D1W8W9_9SPHI|nr:IS4 family transposase [Candidatus Sphingobacterium stercoripullorum]